MMIRQRNPAYIDEELFAEFLRYVFIPYLTKLRSAETFSGEFAICQMNSALPHIFERSLRLFGENPVLAVVFPAHRRNSFQTLDLVFFDGLTKLKTTADAEFDDNSVNDQITFIFSG
jgi:hypothetical protein